MVLFNDYLTYESDQFFEFHLTIIPYQHKSFYIAIRYLLNIK
jgi:hypothetical protein